MNLYVYYDVATDDVERLAREVRAMQAALERSTGNAGRLMKRQESNTGRETWMEVYENVDEAFEPELARAVATIDWLQAGPRHLERFIAR